MAGRPRGLLIIGIQGIDDIPRAKRDIATIPGVVSVSVNQISRKLIMKCDGDAEAVEEISLKIREILERAKSAGDATSLAKEPGSPGQQ